MFTFTFTSSNVKPPRGSVDEIQQKLRIMGLRLRRDLNKARPQIKHKHKRNAAFGDLGGNVDFDHVFLNQ